MFCNKKKTREFNYRIFGLGVDSCDYAPAPADDDDDDD